MAISLITHKRINTTLAKAKALRKYIEPILTRSKENTTHNQRIIFADLQDKKAMKELFGVISPKIASRPGGYTRILRTGFRVGDNAEMCMIELVDFNEVMLKESSSTGTKKTRRSRRKKSENAASEELSEKKD
ncbi:MAG: 50S ribosomal protein L17 [Flammeovirgaceae bacterium]